MIIRFIFRVPTCQGPGCYVLGQLQTGQERLIDPSIQGVPVVQVRVKVWMTFSRSLKKRTGLILAIVQRIQRILLLQSHSCHNNRVEQIAKTVGNHFDGVWEPNRTASDLLLFNCRKFETLPSQSLCCSVFSVNAVVLFVSDSRCGP